MEQNQEEKNRRFKFGNRERNRTSVVKDYLTLYQKGWDIFTMLGESKTFKDLANTENNLREVITKVLNDNDYYENNVQQKLFANYQGLPISTFQELVDVIEEGIFEEIEINNASVLQIIDMFKPGVEKYMKRIADSTQKFTPRDAIALTQQKRIAQNDIIEKDLLTEDKIKTDRLVLSRDAIPFYVKDKKTSTQKEYYDYAAIKFLSFVDDLEMPIKNYYTNEPLLKPEERTFANYNKFIENLKVQKYKFSSFEKRYPEATDMIVSGKNILIAREKPSETENAVYMMYKINRANLDKKSLFLFDRSYKRAKNFFKSVTTKNEDSKFNPYKNFKSNKSSFYEYKDTLNEVISLLSTVNNARIYMEGETFKKVESHLELQASMQLSKIPNIHSGWILPYISEKVLELSKENFAQAGLTDLAQIKQLYERTGRKVGDLETIDEIIFSKVDYSFNAESKRASTKGVDNSAKEPVIDEEKLEDEEFFENFNKNQPLYKMYREQIEKAKKIKQTKEEDKSNPQTQAGKQEQAATEKEKDIALVKRNLKNFLEENIMTRQKENLSATSEINANADYILALRKGKVNLSKVVDTVYNKMSKDIDENGTNYQTEYGNFYQLGALVFKSYFRGPKGRLTPRTDFKKMLQEAVKEVEKNNTEEHTA